MKVSTNVSQITMAALLCAVGIIIPMFSPVRLVLEPASFTLASHVAIFIAMFISPATAAAVSLGTTLGFLLGGFPPVIVARAATHIIFSLAGAYTLSKKPGILSSRSQALLFSLIIGLIHAAAEIAVVTPFYFGNMMSEGYYQKGFIISVLLLVGFGSVIHSMVDFEISLLVWKPLKSTMKNQLVPVNTQGK